MKRAILILSFLLFFISCSEDLPVLGEYHTGSFTLLNQDSVLVEFPELVKGKTTVIGFIFTNCPDICPLTTNNMRLVQEKLKSRNIKGIEFVSISFDPEHDKPSTLAKFAEIRDLDLSNWCFLTGEQTVIDSILKRSGVFAVPGDTSVTSSGDEIVFFIHTDRISLIDREGRIRANYFGSKADIDKIVEDIKLLEENY
jgi:protein SCO1/2